MDLISTNQELNRLLLEATKVARRRDALLTAVADGELRLTEADATRMKAQHQVSMNFLAAIAGRAVTVSHVVKDLDTEWGQVPEGLRAAYQRLFERTYGTRALRVVDTELGRASAKRVSFPLSSSKSQTRGGAKPGKSATAHTRNVIQDQQAWTFKRSIDRRLRVVQSEIRDFLSGGTSPVQDTKICPVCSRFSRPEWVFCPIDGAELVKGD